MKTIFFDWGGVVTDDPGDGFLAGLLQNIGATPDQVSDIFRIHQLDFLRGKISGEQYWNELRNTYSLSIPETIAEEFKKWAGLVANDEILSLVDEAKQKGWQVAILSNVIPVTYHVLKASGAYDKFDAVIVSCNEGYAKPEKEIYEIALQKLNVAAKDSVFIDDKQTNLDPAKEMGFRTIHAENPQQIARDIRAIL